MTNNNQDTDKTYKNPNEDSIVTNNHTGKKVDANLDIEADQPADPSILINRESQKGKKAGGDPEKDTNL